MTLSPKSQFLKARAIALHKSGYKGIEIARMLQVSNDTAYRWTSEEYAKKRHIAKELARAAREATKPIPVWTLPTLPFIPGIQLTERSKYTMRSA